jgi:hypothetical protein
MRCSTYSVAAGWCRCRHSAAHTQEMRLAAPGSLRMLLLGSGAPWKLLMVACALQMPLLGSGALWMLLLHQSGMQTAETASTTAADCTCCCSLWHGYSTQAGCSVSAAGQQRLNPSCSLEEHLQQVAAAVAGNSVQGICT